MNRVQSDPWWLNGPPGPNPNSEPSKCGTKNAPKPPQAQRPEHPSRAPRLPIRGGEELLGAAPQPGAADADVQLPEVPAPEVRAVGALARASGQAAWHARGKAPETGSPLKPEVHQGPKIPDSLLGPFWNTPERVSSTNANPWGPKLPAQAVFGAPPAPGPRGCPQSLGSRRSPESDRTTGSPWTALERCSPKSSSPRLLLGNKKDRNGGNGLASIGGFAANRKNTRMDSL